MAGIQAGTAYIPVKADMSQFGKEVQTGTKQASGKMKTFAKSTAGLIGGAFAAKKVKDFFGASISGAREAIEIDKQTEAVIQSTGGAAGITADHIDKLSNKLQRQQTISDEVVQSGANLLLTFKDIRNEAGEGNNVFDRTVALAGDMSTALGQDMKSSSIQLGKALNDPIKGVASLQRVGVSFTEEQREQIATMQESGDLLGAQTMILGELESQFGGSAEAQADAGKKMSLAWADFTEVIGRLLIPILDKVLGALTKVADWAARNPGQFKIIAGVIGGALVLAFLAWAVSAASAAAATIAAAAPVIAIGAAVAALAAGIVWAYQNVDIFRSAVDAVASFLKDTVWPIIQEGARIFTDVIVPAIGSVIEWAWNLATDIATVVRKVVAKFTEVASWIGTKVGEVVGFFGDVIAKATEMAGWIGEKVGDIVGFVTGLASDIATAAKTMWDPISAAFKTVLNVLIRAWNRLDFGIDIRVPGWIPGVGGKGFQVDDIFPDIPELATGVRNFHGGLAWVGEEGPELVNLPRGSDVFPTGESRQLGTGAPLIGGDYIVQVLPGEDGIGRGIRELRKLQFGMIG